MAKQPESKKPPESKKKTSVVELVLGQDGTFTATVKSSGGGPPPSGDVTFYDNNQAIGTCPIGGAAFEATTATAIVAKYGGDSHYFPSESEVVSPQTRRSRTHGDFVRPRLLT